MHRSRTAPTPPARTGTTDAWRGFVTGPWQDAINVRDFIQRNYTPYVGDAAFLQVPTDAPPPCGSA